MRGLVPRRPTLFRPILVALLCIAPPALAQGDKGAAPEFTRQGLLIVNFNPRGRASMKLAREVGDKVRSRVDKLVNEHEVDVIDKGDIQRELRRSGFDPDSTVGLVLVHVLGRILRADTYLVGYVTPRPHGLRLSGELVLMRDERLRQPIPDAIAPDVDSAAKLFGTSIAAARRQLIPQRRCENSLGAGNMARAIAEARAAVARYPRATIVRTCLALALYQAGAPPAQVLAVANAVLAIDSMSAHAIEIAAVALDTLHRRDEAGAMWLRLARTDTANTDLALRVSGALLLDGNARRAEPFVARMADAHPDNIQLVYQLWRIALVNQSWKRAIGAGEILLARDSLVRSSPTFFLRLARAYHAANEPYRAIETVAHGVYTFPSDAQMYSLYTQYIEAEADTVVPRGLELFPRSADLLALKARASQAKGDIAGSLDAMQQAVALDSTMTHGYLVVAQLEMELGRPDSALAALHQAVNAGEDPALVAHFALANGNTLYEAANGTKVAADFVLALRFLDFADTVQSSPQSEFLAGAAALGAAQSALVEATKVADKPERCRLAHLGASMLPVARARLRAGQPAFADAAQRSLDYLEQLEPYADTELTAYCAPSP